MKKLAKKQAGGSSKSKVEKVESDIMKGKKAPVQIKIALKKANAGMVVKSSKAVSAKPVVKKSVATKPTNIYGKNPATGKEEQMVMKGGRYAFQKKGGATKAKAMPKAMYGKSIMKEGGAKKK